MTVSQAFLLDVCGVRMMAKVQKVEVLDSEKLKKGAGWWRVGGEGGEGEGGKRTHFFFSFFFLFSFFFFLFSFFFFLFSFFFSFLFIEVSLNAKRGILVDATTIVFSKSHVSLSSLFPSPFPSLIYIF